MFWHTHDREVGDYIAARAQSAGSARTYLVFAVLPSKVKGLRRGDVLPGSEVTSSLDSLVNRRLLVYQSSSSNKESCDHVLVGSRG